jgi:hypothetical protein
VFVFDTTPGGVNIDTITDFVVGSDRIALSNLVFGGVGAAGQTLGASLFESGAGLTAATSASTRIFLDTASGALYADSDGVGGAAAVQFASLQGAAASAVGASSFSVEGGPSAQTPDVPDALDVIPMASAAGADAKGAFAFELQADIMALDFESANPHLSVGEPMWF